jgi:hypothetical protein
MQCATLQHSRAAARQSGKRSVMPFVRLRPEEAVDTFGDGETIRKGEI